MRSISKTLMILLISIFIGCASKIKIDELSIEGEVYEEDTNEGLENSRTLNTHQGGNEAEFHRSKRETSNIFTLEKQQVFGNTFGEGMGDPGRYDSGILKTSQLPFTQERVSQIDSKMDSNIFLFRFRFFCCFPKE